MIKLISIIILIIVSIIARGRLKQLTGNTDRPDPYLLPPITANDKMILMEDTPYDKVRKVMLEFCNVYNQEEYVTTVRLTQYSDDLTVLTFPRNMKFEAFLMLVKYLHGPITTKISHNIMAWCTPAEGDNWAKPDMVHKHVMLCVPPNPEEKDDLCMTTMDGIGYRIGYGGAEIKRLPRPAVEYTPQSVSFEELEGRPEETLS